MWLEGHLTDTDEFSQQIFGSAQTPVWKSNFSLSNAAPVCVLKKQEHRKHGFKVIWLKQMNFHNRTLVLSKF